MASILKDWESEVELSRKRGRGRSRVGTYAGHLAAGSLDCIQLSLQLHELLLTGASRASFKEVDDHLRPAKVGKRHCAPAASWNRVAWNGRSDSKAAARARSTAGASVTELRDRDKRSHQNHDAASNRVRPPVA